MITSGSCLELAMKLIIHRQPKIGSDKTLLQTGVKNHCAVVLVTQAKKSDLSCYSS